MDTGKVRFVFRNFPFLGDESIAAAEASECAAEQGKFWEYHDKLVAVWAGEGKGTYVSKNLKAWAAEFKLDTAAFDSCVDTRKYKSAVEKEKADAAGRGVRTTPTVFVANTIIEGERDFNYYAGIINDQLAKAGQ